MKINKFKIIDRCLYLEKEEILIFGDLHFGYEETLNKQGIAIPKIQINESKEILIKILKKCKKVKKVIFLGDVKHYFSSILSQEFYDFEEFIKIIRKKLEKNGEIIIIKGNHDKILEPLIKKFENIKLIDKYKVKNIIFIHGDFLESVKKKGSYFEKEIELIVIGHFHPAMILNDGVKQEKYKCFLYGYSKEINKTIIILPSFFPLIEGSDILSEINWNIDISRFKIVLLDELGRLYNFGFLKNKISAPIKKII